MSAADLLIRVMVRAGGKRCDAETPPQHLSLPRFTVTCESLLEVAMDSVTKAIQWSHSAHLCDTIAAEASETSNAPDHALHSSMNVQSQTVTFTLTSVVCS